MEERRIKNSRLPYVAISTDTLNSIVTLTDSDKLQKIMKSVINYINKGEEIEDDAVNLLLDNIEKNASAYFGRKDNADNMNQKKEEIKKDVIGKIDYSTINNSISTDIWHNIINNIRNNYKTLTLKKENVSKIKKYIREEINKYYKFSTLLEENTYIKYVTDRMINEDYEQFTNMKEEKDKIAIENYKESIQRRDEKYTPPPYIISPSIDNSDESPF